MRGACLPYKPPMPRPNPLLVVSALLFFAAAMPLLFAPEEILRAAGATPTPLAIGLAQALASTLFGFALLDWMARHARIDGIFGRPLVVANLGHTASAALLLARVGTGTSAASLLLGASAVYGALAVAYGWHLFFGGPAERV
jgi:hypothetical protein